MLNINTKRNNLVLTEKNVILWGKDRISDTLCGVKFDISPQSFFQVNPVQTEKLYSKALEYADIDENTSVMDIYCVLDCTFNNSTMIRAFFPITFFSASSRGLFLSSRGANRNIPIPAANAAAIVRQV